MWSLFFNQAGQPMTLMQWITAFEDWTARCVGEDHIRVRGDAVRVSTVWVGIDRWSSALDDGPPLIFESVVFDGALPSEERAYATRDEAVAGHRLLVEQVRAEARTEGEGP